MFWLVDWNFISGALIMSAYLGMMYKKISITKFKVLCWHLFDGHCKQLILNKMQAQFRYLEIMSVVLAWC